MSDEQQAVIVRDVKGRFAPGTRPPVPITAENSIAFHRKRQEKAARLLRERIAQETRNVSTLPVNSGAEAVAEAGSYLWREIVLSPEAYPRDRLAAWESIGKHAGVLGDGKQDQQQAQQVAGHGAVDAVLVLLVADRQADVVEGRVIPDGDGGGDGQAG